MQELMRHIKQTQHCLPVLHLGHQDHDWHVRRYQVQVVPCQVEVGRLWQEGHWFNIVWASDVTACQHNSWSKWCFPFGEILENGYGVKKTEIITGTNLRVEAIISGSLNSQGKQLCSVACINQRNMTINVSFLRYMYKALTQPTSAFFRSSSYVVFQHKRQTRCLLSDTDTVRTEPGNSSHCKVFSYQIWRFHVTQASRELILTMSMCTWQASIVVSRSTTWS